MIPHLFKPHLMWFNLSYVYDSHINHSMWLKSLSLFFTHEMRWDNNVIITHCFFLFIPFTLQYLHYTFSSLKYAYLNNKKKSDINYIFYYFSTHFFLYGLMIYTYIYIYTCDSWDKLIYSSFYIFIIYLKLITIIFHSI